MLQNILHKITLCIYKFHVLPHNAYICIVRQNILYKNIQLSIVNVNLSKFWCTYNFNYLRIYMEPGIDHNLQNKPIKLLYTKCATVDSRAKH